MIVKRKLFLLVLLLLALPICASASDWTGVGGMTITRLAHPAPAPAGAYDWCTWWPGDNGDGTVTYGAFTFPKTGGSHYAKLEVSNSVDSYDAYIEQTIDVGIAAGKQGYLGQQFLAWGNPTNGATHVWIELDYGNGEVDRTPVNATWSATGPWASSYVNVQSDSYPLSSTLTIRIGLVKDSTTTGTRTLIVEDALLWATQLANPWPGYPQWESFGFNNYVRITPSTIPLVVAEQGPTSTTYEAVCVGAAPVSNVVVWAVPDVQTEINSSGAGIPVALTFTAGNYSTAQTVTVKAIDDAAQESTHYSVILHDVNSTDAGYSKTAASSEARSLTVHVMDNDIKEILISPVSLSLDEDGETSDTYVVTMGAAPTDDVNVIATSSSVADATLNIGGGAGGTVVMTFTPVNWNTPQTVTVKAVDDSIAEPPLDAELPETVTVTHTTTTSDVNYAAATVPDVSVGVWDDDKAGWLPVGGMNISYELHPAPAPAGVYAWSWTGDDSLAPDGDGIANYGETPLPIDGGYRYGVLEVDNSVDSYDAYITQKITYTGDHDGTGNNDGQYFIAWGNAENGATGVWVDAIYNDGEETDHWDHAAVSGPWQRTYMWYNSTVDDINSITIRMGVLRDPDQTTGTRRISIEDAVIWCWGYSGRDRYQKWVNFHFDLKPDWRENLIVPLGSANPMSVWEQGPTTTTYRLESFSDFIYSPVNKWEGSFSAGLNRANNNPPTANVVITADPDAQSQINSQGAGNAVQFTFTPTDYNIPQTVTVAPIDDAVKEGDHTTTITHTSASSDAEYNETITENVVVNIEDNDVNEVRITPEALTVSEPNTAATYTVRTMSPPSASVTVTATSSSPDDAKLDIGGGLQTSVVLTFTTGNWSTAQTVTVRAVDDALSEGPEIVTVSHVAASGDATYNGIDVNSLAATVEDDEEYCGEDGQPYDEFDIAGPDGIGLDYRDCHVDGYDYAALASQWQSCTNRFLDECIQW